MIIAALKGGLGNQLFQYAVGRSLSLLRRTDLKFDVTWYEDPDTRAGLTPRRFELDKFKIAAGRASNEDIARVRSAAGGGSLSRLTGLLRRGPPSQLIREKKYFAFDRQVLEAGPNAYLDGYWQNERYFEGCAPTIRDDLKPSSPALGANDTLLSEISNSESVGVHIRRGDYTSAGSEPHSHVLLTAEYFSTAMRRMAATLREPKFFVFSDDHQWARKNLGEDFHLRYVEHNDVDDAAEDLRLMSACRHQVISNSTFSWWAAWLNTYALKKVIAPARWFVGDTFDISGLMPKSWERI